MNTQKKAELKAEFLTLAEKLGISSQELNWLALKQMVESKPCTLGTFTRAELISKVNLLPFPEKKHKHFVVIRKDTLLFIKEVFLQGDMDTVCIFPYKDIEGRRLALIDAFDCVDMILRHDVDCHFDIENVRLLD